jgi:AraC-like DNA-binding protein
MALDESLSLRRYGASHGSHTHTHYQVLVGLEGVLELEVAGRGRRIAAGDGWVVPPGERHDFESREGSHCLVLDTAMPAWGLRLTPLTPTDQALHLARYLAVALASGQPLAQRHGAALLLECWAPAYAPTRPRRAIAWSQLARWAATQWHKPLTVADLAAQVHLSPTQFAARCLQENGQSAMAWLRQLRLAQARDLRVAGWSVNEIARRCGYRSTSALTAALRRDTPLH